MCKFHKDVARDVATNPVTGEFDSGQYSVALVAMAKFRIEQYMPAMHGCDGFVPKKMVTDAAVKALDESGLKRPAQEITAYRDATIMALKSAMALTAQSCDLSMQGLNIPDNITKDGYKHCARMAADLTKNGPFLDEAVVQLFEGYNDVEKCWARGNLNLTAVAHKPQFEAIRSATEHFLSQPGVTEILKQRFEHSLATVFTDARKELDAGNSLKSDGCVMCGHGDRAKNPPQPKA